MLNILITNDDGPDATGLTILQEAVQKTWPGIKTTTIVPSRPRPGTGMSLTRGWESWQTTPAVEYAPNKFALELTPADIIYRAMHKREEFSLRPWDLVLVGVNHGANVGFDIYHSGTAGMAMTAATGFGVAAFAFSQELADTAHLQVPNLERSLFAAAERILPDFLRKTSPDGGVCWNVNFPIEANRGYMSIHPAHYSHFRIPPTSLVPRSAEEKSDITYLEQGYVTISELQLRVRPPNRY